MENIAQPISIETRKRYIINFTMFVLLVGVIVSSLYFLYVPGGYQGGRNPRFNMRIVFERETWDGIHVWTSMILSGVLMAHILLHQNWIKQVFFKYARVSNSIVSVKAINLRQLNTLDDGLSALFFVICLFSGLVLLFIPGGKGTASIEFLAITRGAWKDIHTWSGVGMLAGILIASHHSLEMDQENQQEGMFAKDNQCRGV